MDLKKKDKSSVPQPNTSDTQNYFTESNAGHISVQTISPFRMRGSEYATGKSLKCKTERSSFFGKKLMPKDACSSATSKLLIKQIIREHSLDGDGLLKEGHVDTTHHRHHIENTCNYSQSFLINHVEFKHSAPTINSKHSSMRLGLCSREESIVPAEDDQCNNTERRIYSSNSIFSSKAIEKKQYAEKTTYCRPVLSFNKEFVSKTRDKNIRLQQLVKKLVIARKREKETEALNNYINELKTRHGIDQSDSERSYLPQEHEYTQVDSIDQFYKSTLNRSSKCNELLEEFYGASDAEQYSNSSCIPAQYCYDNSYQCYPMSSQGRFMMLKKERRNPFSQDWQYHTPRSREFRGNTIVVDREKIDSRQLPKACRSSTYRRNSSFDSYKIRSRTNSVNYNHKSQFKEFATQTSIENSLAQESMVRRGETFIRDTLQEQYIKVTENVDRLKKKIQETVERKVNQETPTPTREGTGVLRSIENKLDTLITSLNSFFYDSSPGTSNDQCYYCHSLHFNKHQIHNMNSSKSYTFGLNNTEKIVCGLIAENALKPLPYKALNRTFAHKTYGTDINKLLIQEIDSISKVKNDNGHNLNHNTLKQRITDNSIDTKEHSTEVTNSLSKSLLRFQDRSVSMRKISRDGSGDIEKMTTSVNTDPLSLLALLKISSETMRQYLSYMPNFSYYSYLQMIQFPQIRQNPSFVCNICGAAFERPSQLSDHIQGHDLRTRDCCVCRHILDMQSQRPTGLFRCQYCGQRFTRAYCCELHQESCAKRFGLKHDITPSLMLLR